MIDAEQIFNMLTGQNGGIFALGVASGYIYAGRTILKEAKARITHLEERVEQLNADLIQEIRGRS